MEYPFQPKSTLHFQVGNFWPILLPDGDFACGMVLALTPGSRTMFLAALLDWRGSEPPTGSDLIDCKVLEQGEAHLKVIKEGYGWITGMLPKDVEPPSPLLWTEHLGEAKWGLYRGFELINVIDSERAEQYPRKRTWGYNVINRLAARRLSTQQDA
ncbi:MAG: hypothetical protein P1U59_01405 [Alcanivorax sp.]|uniref:hypothetical protein n=1 Tax=Alcanivorax sp. TaxID=1872427 RepID=UPI0026212B94|nr:hypothetical protein [Alcanivorax sp.]MDF1723140.1 hypothetical protein [Alcanivorax sp.]